MAASGLHPEEVRGALHNLERLDIAGNDVMELQRLAERSAGLALVALRPHRPRMWHLERVRACCEQDGIPVQSAIEAIPNVWRLRETQALLAAMRAGGTRLIGHAARGAARRPAARTMDRVAGRRDRRASRGHRWGRHAVGPLRGVPGPSEDAMRAAAVPAAAADRLLGQGPGVRSRGCPSTAGGTVPAMQKRWTRRGGSATWP